MANEGAALEIDVLGPLRVRRGDELLLVRGQRRRALLALLTVDDARPLGADELAERLGGTSERSRRSGDRLAGLYALVSRVRGDLGPAADALSSGPDGYRLRAELVTIDVRCFERQLDALANIADPMVRLAELDRTLALWRGEPWLELADDLTARTRAQHLAQRWSSAQQQRGELLLQVGRVGELLAEMVRWRATDPHREDLVSLHCRGLYRLGRQRDALLELRAFMTRLAEDTGLTASPELVELERRLLSHDPVLAKRTTAAPAAAFPARLTNRPGVNAARRRLSGGPLRGRHREVAQLLELLARSPVVTVVGTAGCGKTRLALETVERLDAQATPVAFVDLSETRDAAALASVAAAALGVEVGARSSVLDAVVDYLAAVPHVVLLDNCEHVLPAVRTLVSAVLGGAPRCGVLATSRAALSVPGEHVLRLEPLDTEGRTTPIDSPAAQLFLDSALRVGAALELSGSNMDSVAALCRSLDGLPLALELAGSQLVAFGLDDLVRRLDRRLDLLGDRGVGHGRHGTLRTAVDWSYELLDPASQQLFCQLAVMPAGATLEALEWFGGRLLCGGEVHASIARLVDSSMVLRVEATAGSRYQLLETMRSYGLDRVQRGGGLEAAEELLIEWCLKLLARQQRSLLSDAEPYWNDRVRDEFPNIRAVRAALRRGEPRVAELVELSSCLDEWARVRDLDELWAWAEDLLELTRSVDGRLHARAQVMAAQGAFRRSGFVEAGQLAQAALDGEPDAWTIPRALTNLGASRLFAGDFSGAVAALERRVELDGDVCDRACVAFTRAYRGDIDAARTDAGTAIAAARASGSPNALAWAEYAAGEIESIAGSGDHEPHLRRAVELGRRAGAPITVGVALVTLTAAEARSGQVAAARDGYLELLEHWLKAGGITMLWTTLRNAAELLAPFNPEMALIVWERATDDPYASSLSDEAAATQARMQNEAEHRLGPSATTTVRQQAQTLTRSTLIEAVRQALQNLKSKAGSD